MNGICARGLRCDADELCNPSVPEGDARLTQETEDPVEAGTHIIDNREDLLYCGPDEVCGDQLTFGSECTEDPECLSHLCLEDSTCEDETWTIVSHRPRKSLLIADASACLPRLFGS